MRLWARIRNDPFPYLFPPTFVLVFVSIVKKVYIVYGTTSAVAWAALTILGTILMVLVTS